MTASRIDLVPYMTAVVGYEQALAGLKGAVFMLEEQVAPHDAEMDPSLMMDIQALAGRVEARIAEMTSLA